MAHSFQAADGLDRAKGALLGLAVGDALGTTLEFSRRDRLPPVTDIVGGGPFGLPAGVWTDDTSMALCLADSLVAAGAFDPYDVMQRFIRWWQKGENSPTGTCFDIGLTTRQALAKFLSTDDPFAGDTAPDTAGNGSLMRLAPAVIFAAGDASLADEVARKQSRLTHAAPEAVDACAFLASLMNAALAGADHANILAPQTWNGEPAIAAIAAGSWRDRARETISSSGYVVHTLEAALWCVGQSRDFKSAVVAAANLGDDADTVGAVTGQLAGSIWGAKALPDTWLARLAWREHIEDLAARLWRRA